jgi:D-aminopeptidase
VGVLVQCNYGRRGSFASPAFPSARKFPSIPPTERRRLDHHRDSHRRPANPDATQAPGPPRSLGLGRDGSYSGDGSGDIFIAFSTANPGAASSKGVRDLKMLPNDSLDPIFLATVQATEEAIVNAMVAAETMTGIDGHTAIALPHDRLREVLKKYNRLAKVRLFASGTGVPSAYATASPAQPSRTAAAKHLLPREAKVLPSFPNTR